MTPKSRLWPSSECVPAVDVYHSRLETNVARATIEDAVEAAVQIVEHVLSGRGARSAGKIGARRGDGSLREVDELVRDRMRGHTNGYRRLSAGDLFGHHRLLGKQKSERSRPESVHELLRVFGHLANERLEHSLVTDVYDQRVVVGTVLSEEDL